MPKHGELLADTAEEAMRRAMQCVILSYFWMGLRGGESEVEAALSNPQITCYLATINLVRELSMNYVQHFRRIYGFSTLSTSEYPLAQANWIRHVLCVAEGSDGTWLAASPAQERLTTLYKSTSDVGILEVISDKEKGVWPGKTDLDSVPSSGYLPRPSGRKPNEYAFTALMYDPLNHRVNIGPQYFKIS